MYWDEDSFQRGFQHHWLILNKISSLSDCFRITNLWHCPRVAFRLDPNQGRPGLEGAAFYYIWSLVAIVQKKN
jgi:hypothetical protein